jgi:hypothetical protein
MEIKNRITKGEKGGNGVSIQRYFYQVERHGEG